MASLSLEAELDYAVVAKDGLTRLGCQRSVEISWDCHETLPLDFGNLALFIPSSLASILHR